MNPKDNQFGGQNGCSTYHFLAETIDQFTEHLENSKVASVLTSIDYSKAFNRVEHGPLLAAFAKKGAPTQLIALLATFLSNRQMTVKLGGSYSKKRPVNAGAPQGSVLGTYVFNIATDDLEDNVSYDDLREENQYQLNEGDLSFLETEADVSTTQSTPQRPVPIAANIDLSPVETTQRFVFLPNARNVPPSLSHRIEPLWREKPISVRKFVDDNIQIQKVHMRKQLSYSIDNKTFKNPRVRKSERLFSHIARNARRKGLIVNSSKTNLLVISAAKSYEARAHFYDGRERVDSTKTMKVLGFLFNNSGDCTSQVDSLCRKTRQKIWTLRHLRKAGFNESELLEVYKFYIRLTIEYSSPIYHSMLTQEQQIYIERQQFFPHKNIYGFVYSHRQLLEMSRLSTLLARREAACLKFAKKTEQNPRFAHWFLKKNARTGRKRYQEYIEMQARTDRRRNSPVFSYRRLLNKDRIDYDVRNPSVIAGKVPPKTPTFNYVKLPLNGRFTQNTYTPRCCGIPLA